MLDWFSWGDEQIGHWLMRAYVDCDGSEDCDGDSEYGGLRDEWDQSIAIEVKVVRVSIEALVEDRMVNGVRSGLEELSLEFLLNGVLIPKSSLAPTRTTSVEDGVTILTQLGLSYHPRLSELVLPGPNVVEIHINDNVMNAMDPAIRIFNIP